jgi:peptide methionine sulfoxide reductase
MTTPGAITSIPGTETAVLAGGCFWGMEDLIRKRPGVIDTRVGYTGGDVPNATYRNHGTHAEAIEIVFDPSKVSYRERHRPELPLGHLPDHARAGDHGVRDDRRRRRLGHLARTGHDRGLTRRAVLGGGARAPGLPGALPQRLHVPLRAAGLEAAQARRGDRRLGTPRQRRASARRCSRHRLTTPRTVQARATRSIEPSGAVGSTSRSRSRRRSRRDSSSDIAYAGATPWPPRNGSQ